MFKQKKDIVYLVLLLAVTAAVFFVLGTLSSSIFGIVSKQTTRIEYVPQPSKTTITTTSTTTTTATDTTTKTVSATKSSITTNPSTTTTTAAPKEKQFNLNTVTKEELMSIDGIGETYAQRILDYRTEIGGFDYLEQLMEIEGIGEGRFKAWSVYLYVE